MLLETSYSNHIVVTVSILTQKPKIGEGDVLLNISSFAIILINGMLQTGYPNSLLNFPLSFAYFLCSPLLLFYSLCR